jgi:hypothetical protein
MVSLDHNDPDLAGLRSDLSAAIELVRGDNEFERAAEMMAPLQYAENLLSRAELGLTQLKVGLVMALDDALSIGTKWAKIAVVESVKAAAVDWIRKHFPT